MSRTYLIFTLLFLLIFQESGWSTHNRAGEITYRQTGPLTIEVKITTYTKISGTSINADRPSLDIHWGDGAVQTLARDNFVMVHPDIRRNEYIGTHTYPGPNPGGQPYIVWMQDPNRNESILNINGGNSVNIEFYLQTEVFLFPTSIFGFNSSPILLEPPVDFGVVGQIFQHTPNGYDPDGDSIAYELIVPQSNVGSPVPGYQLVSDIGPGPLNSFSFDVRTGLFTWNAPQIPGEYNIAILVKSYRNGLYLGGLVRDIQIEIKDAQNTAPRIETEDEICVEAGTYIEFDVEATDSDIPLQNLRLTATGGPFLVSSSPANFANVSGFSPLSSRFRWQTNCSHVELQPFQLVFKARDTYTTNGGAVDASLSTFKVVKIKVIGPAPQNLQAAINSGQVDLTWNAPYQCASAANFLGFSVWRKESCDPFVPDTCEIGLAGRGYTQINLGNLVRTPNAGSYRFTDLNVSSGSVYSYRVMAEFATPISGTNNFHSPVSGKASLEICVQMAEDLPMITHVDIEETDPATGKLYVRWAAPRASELDTLFNTPPYRYELYRSSGQSGSSFSLLPVWTSPLYNSYSALGDTIEVLEQNLNTKDSAWSYKLAFYANNDTLGETVTASSLFLKVNSTDRKNILNWTALVPWVNYRYVVFKEQPTGSLNFIVLDTVNTLTYTDDSLVNGQTYCYYIESTGTYGLPGIIDTLVNRSQIACGTPLDTIAPCAPVAVAGISACSRYNDDSNLPDRGLCEGNILEQSMMFNEIKWKKADDSCTADQSGYRLYFAPFCNGQWQLVADFSQLSDTVYLHQPANGNLAGCYYITSIDSIEVNGGGNESQPSAIVQTDNCPFYELPNVFTPNGDGSNDVFHPCLPYRFIIEVDCKIFNRWGQMVYQTKDPEINWDGRDMQTGKLLAEDVYFYICNITQSCIQCPAVKPLTGNIHIIHGGSK